MSTKLAIECEMCSNRLFFPAMTRPQEREMPTTWFVVFQGPHLYAQEGWHFCSSECLNAWSNQRVADEEEVGNE